MRVQTNRDWYGFFANLEVNMIIQEKPHVVTFARENKCRYYRLAKNEAKRVTMHG
ncbi:MAG: hypothetical protein K0Q56_920 [Sporolactobacillus laevolacticus]|jgi:hypothetical protein|nr:hypothetical protein [Sporolactobacillus laevolacticus]